MSGPIFLYGPPGSGKTCVGRLLAKSLDLPFADLDAAIEERSGITIPEIFARETEAGFRQRELQALQDVLLDRVGVLALGGGTLLRADSRSLVQAVGQVLCLNAPTGILLDRLRGDGVQRPLLADGTAKSLPELLARRADHYASFGLQLDTDGLSIEQAVLQAQVLLGMFHVRGMGRGYDVRVQSGGLATLGEAMRQRGLRGPIALVSDENVAAIYAEPVTESLRSSGYVIHEARLPAGEEHKNLKAVSSLWESFVRAGLERGSTVVALGGGVVGDLAGFAAATLMRGIAWVNAPTSLLAMIDASLGGKTGANLPQGKNLIGAFHAPRLVLTDPQALATLPDIELRSGLAEVVKHGVIADPDLYHLCAQGRQAVDAHLEEIVRRGMAVKIGVIQEDPFESGRREVLNLGHTIGHAIELTSGYRVRHGEAIAMGIVAEARMSEALGLAETGLADNLAGVLTGLRLPVDIPADFDRASLVAAMGVDKKRSGGAVRFALPVRVGEVRIGVEIESLDTKLMPC